MITAPVVMIAAPMRTTAPLRKDRTISGVPQTRSEVGTTTPSDPLPPDDRVYSGPTPLNTIMGILADTSSQMRMSSRSDSDALNT